MSFDVTTQAISRFIGLFELIVEEARLRHDYLKFKSKPSAAPATEPIPGISAQLVIGGQPEGFDPGLAYRPPAPPAKTVETAPAYHYSPVHVSLVPIQLAPVSVESLFVPAPEVTIAAAGVVYDGPPSLVGVTIQLAWLVDDDLFLDGMGAEFVDVVALHAALARIEAVAEAMVGFDIPAVPSGSDWMGVIKAVLEQLDAPPAVLDHAGMGGSPEIHLYRGEEAQGQFVNGTASEEAPAWTDLLPVYLRPAFGKDETTDGDGAVVGGGSATPPGLSVSDGETIMRTSTSIDGKSETVRPPEHDFSRDFEGRSDSEGLSGHKVVAGANAAINEIAIGSQWIDASVIVVQGDVAKLHAISQVNVLVEHDRIDGVPVAQGSTGINIAEIVTTSSATGETNSDVLPSGAQIFRLEADLYQVNWIKQFTFLTDFDRAEVTFAAQMTFLGLGENEIVNSAIMNQFGYRFDLMFVSGNMIDSTIISQKNVLFDSDTITTGAGAKGGAGAGMSLSDNLLYNKATIETVGVDTYAEMTDTFAAAADDLAAGKTSLSKALMQDKLLAGQELLRVLQIDGDLVKTNIFEQTNIVGDADQLWLDMQRMRDEFAADIALVAGSNALVNIAAIAEYGLDSTIMARGKVYDDALIHQAEWFDTDAPANGVKMAGLTQDAVAAFLAEDMGQIRDAAGAIVPTASYEPGSNVDVMQSVLA